MSREPVSVLVPTLDEEHNLADCLESVRWADELLVVDSGSRDRTCELARGLGARVLEHTFSGWGTQKNWAALQARHSWILNVDADERVTPELRDEIQALAERGFGAAAYSIPRRAWFAGRLMRHGGWGRDRVARLYQRERARFSERLVHESLEVEGETVELKAPLLHLTYQSFGQYMLKVDRYARAGARQLDSEGQRASTFKLVVTPLARFVRIYLLQAGFLDGTAGFLMASVAAWSVFARFMYLRELQPAGQAASPEEKTHGSIQRAP